MIMSHSYHVHVHNHDHDHGHGHEHGYAHEYGTLQQQTTNGRDIASLLDHTNDHVRAVTTWCVGTGVMWRTF